MTLIITNPPGFSLLFSRFTGASYHLHGRFCGRSLTTPFIGRFSPASDESARDSVSAVLQQHKLVVHQIEKPCCKYEFTSKARSSDFSIIFSSLPYDDN
jgi:hypothetical protein